MTAGPVLVFSLSEAASAVVHQLHRDRIAVALATDYPPKVHRRRMSFADAWWDGEATLTGVICRRHAPEQLAADHWPSAAMPLLALALAEAVALLPWSLLVDGRLAKRGQPLALRGAAPLTIGCGTGHVVGGTCDLAIETQWGYRLGAVITRGPTAAFDGESRAIAGIGRERFFYAASAGTLTVQRDIGDKVTAGETVALIGQSPVQAPITGTLRGILRHGIAVEARDKICEVDPCPSDRAIYAGLGERPRAIAEGVLDAVDGLAVGGAGCRRHRV